MDPDSEIDFDLIHGTSLTDPSKPLVLYWDRQKALAHYKSQNSKLLIMEIFTLLISLSPAILGIYIWNTILPGILVIPLAALMFATSFFMITISIVCNFRRDLAFRQDITLSMKPIIEIHPEGIGVHCPSRNFDLIPWAAIREVRAESVYSWRLLRIIPKDPEYVLSLEAEDPSLSQKSRRSQLSTAIHFHNRKSLFPCPKELKEISIDVPEWWLPFSADEVAEFINIRLSKYRIEGKN